MLIRKLCEGRLETWLKERSKCKEIKKEKENIFRITIIIIFQTHIMNVFNYTFHIH